MKLKQFVIRKDTSVDEEVITKAKETLEAITEGIIIINEEVLVILISIIEEEDITITIVEITKEALNPCTMVDLKTEINLIHMAPMLHGYNKTLVKEDNREEVDI